MLESCFWDLESDDFAEYMSDIFVDLQKNNVKIIELFRKKKLLKNNNRKLEDFLSGFSVSSLNEEEIKTLIEIGEIDKEIQAEYEKTIFLAGCRENYKYVRSIGLID